MLSLTDVSHGDSSRTNRACAANRAFIRSPSLLKDEEFTCSMLLTKESTVISWSLVSMSRSEDVGNVGSSGKELSAVMSRMPQGGNFLKDSRM